jgi:hypothetical protein
MAYLLDEVFKALHAVGYLIISFSAISKLMMHTYMNGVTFIQKPHLAETALFQGIVRNMWLVDNVHASPSQT